MTNSASNQNFESNLRNALEAEIGATATEIELYDGDESEIIKSLVSIYKK